ncbi:hypothetical protein GGF37_007578 [Kickxella alabastrina]|nr:hypothetical protein GGF37_007578 [Kickxella alabastrina]
MLTITFPLPPPPPTASTKLPSFEICNVNWEELAIPIILISVFVFTFIVIYLYLLAAAPKANAISTMPGGIFAATADDTDNGVDANSPDDADYSAPTDDADYAAAANAIPTARRSYRSHLAEIAGLDPSDCEGYNTELTDESDNELDALFAFYAAEDAKRNAENASYYAEQAMELDDIIASL